MSTSTFCLIPQDFDPRRIPLDVLLEFRKWVTVNILNDAGRYGEFLHFWLQDEELRQEKTPEHVTTIHLMGIPNDLPKWELHEVAQAAYLANEISRGINDEALGRLFDHQVAAFTHYLAFQLAPGGAQ